MARTHPTPGSKEPPGPKEPSPPPEGDHPARIAEARGGVLAGYEPPLPTPSFRRLRAFAFDPSLRTHLDTAVMNEITIQVPWECDPETGKSTLKPGPVGEYLEVVDVDPASECVYMPVDLDHPELLAQDGLPPSEGNPKFHQQMVYAVAMTTLRHFESALGRRVLWSPHFLTDAQGNVTDQEYVPRLRIYPHALREANAYYSPEKKALLFGYFPASATDSGDNLPGGMVFTCLSHDIVAHETTHALLDGMHRRYIEASNIDALAFHEAFADIVALFQHFSYPDVLSHEIERTRGDLARQNQLGKLAWQFGNAVGRYGALRDALGQIEPKTRRWQPAKPDPTALSRVTEPHERGSILVAAVFDAFISIYKSRITDLVRIASNGTGVLPSGAIHPDLVARLTREAAVAAKHVLTMCIRALDYCPPVDVDFGDFFRALITADYDLVHDDDRGYRIAVLEAFRRRGIFPAGIRSLSEESLLWYAPTRSEQERYLRFFQSDKPTEGYEKVFETAAKVWKLFPNMGLSADRLTDYKLMRKNCFIVHGWLLDYHDQASAADKELIRKELGLELDAKTAPHTIERSEKDGRPKVEVHSVRSTRRIGPDGERINDLVIEITQKRKGYLDPEFQKAADGDPEKAKAFKPEFTFRGGCTLLIDLRTGRVRYVIGKGVHSEARLAAQRRFLTGNVDLSLRATYLRDPQQLPYLRDPRESATDEPLAMLHRSAGAEEKER
jgi:hypothetical protein